MKSDAPASCTPRTLSSGCWRRLTLAALSAALLATLYWQQAGSDDGRGDENESITGSIVHNGRPLPAGTIEFTCQIAREGETRFPEAMAVVHQGEFSIAADRGLVPGVYLVRIVADNESPEDCSATENEEAGEGACGDETPVDSAAAVRQGEKPILVVVRKNHRNHFEIVLDD